MPLTSIDFYLSFRSLPNAVCSLPVPTQKLISLRDLSHVSIRVSSIFLGDSRFHELMLGICAAGVQVIGDVVLNHRCAHYQVL